MKLNVMSQSAIAFAPSFPSKLAQLDSTAKTTDNRTSN